MVLAAGRGKRLRPLTDTRPKPLIPVAGRPLLHHTMTYLRNCGVRDVVVNLHHLGGQIRAFLGDGGRWGLRVTYSPERRLLGTGGGIRQAAPFLAGGPFVVMNADILLELDLREVVRLHRAGGAAVTLVLREDPEADRFGTIEVDAEGRVRQFLGKLDRPGVPTRPLMFTGVHVLEPEVFSYMPASEEVFSIVDVYLAMLRAGKRVLGYETSRFWTDLGTPERYAAFQRMLERGNLCMERLVSGCGAFREPERG